MSGVELVVGKIFYARPVATPFETEITTNGGETSIVGIRVFELIVDVLIYVYVDVIENADVKCNSEIVERIARRRVRDDTSRFDRPCE